MLLEAVLGLEVRVVVFLLRAEVESGNEAHLGLRTGFQGRIDFHARRRRWLASPSEVELRLHSQPQPTTQTPE